MSPGDFPRISKVWGEEVVRASVPFPGILERVGARVTPEAGLTGRAFGFFDEEGSTVGLSPRLEAEPEERIRGIIRHELGHACDLLFRPDLPGELGSEARADLVAELIWNSPVTYDFWEVQTSSPRGAPRPKHLHQ